MIKEINSAKALIKQGNLKAALAMLLPVTENNAAVNEQLMMHAARLSDLSKKESMGMVSFENAHLTRNQIAYAVIDLLGNMEEEAGIQQKRVFISYNHKDAAIANLVKDHLVKAGIDVTIDSEAMGAGENIKTFIEKSVRDTETTLSIVSVNSLLSAWVAMETLNSFGLQLGQVTKKFIPCYIQPDFFDAGFTDKAGLQLDEKIVGLAAIIGARLKKGEDSLDVNEEYSRLIKLRNSLGEIIGRLKNSLCIDISNGQLEANLPKIIQKIKE
jgi:hypothetical protein